MHAHGGTHIGSALDQEYMVNPSLGYLKLTQISCSKPWFQKQTCTFETVGLGGGWKI